MSLPYMSDKSMMRDVVRRQFGGINNNLNATDGEITWMINMSSREFPLLCPRDRRGLERTLTSPKGIAAQDVPFWIDGNTFYYGGAPKGEASSGELVGGSLQMVAFGTKILIFPSKRYYDILTDEMGDMDPGGRFPYNLSFQNGELYGVPAEGNTLYAPGAAWAFSVGDAVTISGCVGHPENNKTLIVREVDGDYLRFDEYAFTLDSPIFEVPAGGLASGTYHFSEGQFTLGQTKTLSNLSFQDGELQAVRKTANTIYKSGAAWPFAAGDTVIISGCTAHPENNKTAVVQEVNGDYLRFKENTFTLDVDRVYYTDNTELPLGTYYFQSPRGLEHFEVEFRPIPRGSKLIYKYYEGKLKVEPGRGGDPEDYIVCLGGAVGTKLLFIDEQKKYKETASVSIASASIALEDAEAEGAILAYNGKGLTIHDRGNTYHLRVTEGTDGTALVFSDVPIHYTEDAEVSVNRSVPDLSYACVNENRVWGCKGDTIYASALGDPFNFNVFDGLSSDSWQSDTTDAGDFTGCISYQGYPIFFKEDSIYKIQGDGATNFAWTRTSRFGVKAGSHKSLAVAGETLFYLSRVGVCAYQGGMPTVVSDPLGVNTKWESGVAGSDGLRYYVDLYDGTAHSLYVFDSRYRVWHREDASQALGFAFWDGGLYMLCTDGKLWRMDGSSGTRETSLAWGAIFADSVNFYETSESGSERKKGPLRMLIRATLDGTNAATGAASINVYISYDDGPGNLVGTITGTDGLKRTYILPMVLQRCDHYRITLDGTGDAVIYSLSIEKYNGTEHQSAR